MLCLPPVYRTVGREKAKLHAASASLPNPRPPPPALPTVFAFSNSFFNCEYKKQTLR